MDLIKTGNELEDSIREELESSYKSKKKRIFSKLVSAALGSVPWVGGFLSAMATLKSDEEQIKSNELFKQWLEEHTVKMKHLGDALISVMKRLDEFPDDLNDRLESEEYLTLVRKSFRSWDNSDTEEKRELVRKLLSNAGADKLVPDDLVRLFLDWIDKYHEAHFSVIREIYSHSGITRRNIWLKLNSAIPREDSSEADLFRLLIHDLSTGRVIRQYRPTDAYGNFIKKKPVRGSSRSSTMKSAFDDIEPYELTELGKQFVHYTMDDVVPRIG